MFFDQENSEHMRIVPPPPEVVAIPEPIVDNARELELSRRDGTRVMALGTTLAVNGYYTENLFMTGTGFGTLAVGGLWYLHHNGGIRQNLEFARQAIRL